MEKYQAELLQAESLACRLLGNMLVGEPRQELLEILIEQDVFEDIPFSGDCPETQRGLSLLQNWSSQQNPDDLDIVSKDLGREYFNLFIGPGAPPAPLWESVYFGDKGLVFDSPMLDVRSWYSRFGLQNEKKNKEPDDSIALELLFVAHLADLVQKEENEDDALTAHHAFMEEHPLCWAEVWGKLTEKHTRSDFYGGIALLVRGVLKTSAKAFGLKSNHRVTNPYLLDDVSGFESDK